MIEIVCTVLICVCCVELCVIVDQAKHLSQLQKMLLVTMLEEPIKECLRGMPIEMTEVKADDE